MDTENMKDLVEKLKLLGVEIVQIEYAGYDDNGQMDSIVCKNSKNQNIDVPSDLEDELDSIGYEVLRRYFDGWEINDGSQGVITVNVNDCLIEVDHGENITTTKHHHEKIQL